MPELDDDTRAHAITVLLGGADTTAEINAITRVAHRTGFLWRCPDCRRDHYPTDTTCCGKPRPDDS